MIGRTISHYKIIEKLGGGGMGVVYKARDTKLDRTVALKFLPPHMHLDQEAEKRFISEAKAASSFDHPNICTIYEIDKTDDDRLFIAMAYYEGETLKKKLDQGHLKIDEVIDYSIQITNGLERAHEAGITHRDIKPANIMITNRGEVKILDFGLAKTLNDPSVTKAGTTMGTASYMSPEQASGKEVNHQTDIWSLGVVMYQMITGELPFKGDYEQAIIYSIINEEPESLDEKGQTIPTNFKEIISHCLKKSTEERYPSTKKLFFDLSLIKQNTNTVDTENINFIPFEYSNGNEAFIGREQEIGFLQSKLNGILKKRGAAVFLQGESGVGKTLLLRYVISKSANEQINTIWGRCVFQEGELPYHPFVRGIKNNIKIVDEKFIDSLLSVSARGKINIKGRIPYIKAFLNLSSEQSEIINKEQLWDSILELFKVFCRQKPLVVVIDDLQWADKTTLGLFSYIARNIFNLPILLIGIYRRESSILNDANNKSLITEMVRQLRIEGTAEQLDLNRFTDNEIGEVVSQLFDNQHLEKQLLEKISKQTEGHPLFVSEMIKLMKVKQYVKFENNVWKLNINDETQLLPPKVQDVIIQRLTGLSEDDKEILEIASCEGEYFHSDTVAACLNMKKLSLLKHLQSLENKYNLIHHYKNRYRFDHLMIRQSLQNSILPELRQEYHKMIAQWLIEKYSSNEEYSSRISYHLIEAGKEIEAINYLLAAAKRARHLYAIEESLTLYKKLQDIIDKINVDDILILIEVKEGLGDVHLSLGKAQKANEYYNEFLKLSEAAQNTESEIKALRKSAEALRILGVIEDAFSLSNKSIDKSNQLNNNEEMINCLNVMAIIYATKGEYDQAIKISKKVLSITKQMNDLRNRSICLSNLGFAYWHMGNYPSAMRYLNEANQIQQSIGDKPGLSTTLNFLGLAYWKLGEYNKALNVTSESITIKKGIADFRKIPGSLNIIGDIYRDLNEIDKAIEFHNQSLELASEHQNKGAMCDNLRDLGEDYLLKGNSEMAFKYYEKVLELSKKSGIKWYESRTYLSLSEFYYLTGDMKNAKDYSDLGAEYAKKLNAKDLIIESLWNRARVNSGEEKVDVISKWFREAIELAESVGHKTFLWQLYKDFGLYLSNKGQEPDGKIYLDKANDVLSFIIEKAGEESKEIFKKSPKVKELLEVI